MALALLVIQYYPGQSLLAQNGELGISVGGYVIHSKMSPRLVMTKNTPEDRSCEVHHRF